MATSGYFVDMSYEVTFTIKVAKGLEKLPQDAYLAMQALVLHLIQNGPTAADWPNAGWMKGKWKGYYHCHIMKKKPRYVAMWKVEKNQKQIEVTYVGTHEKAPY